MKKKEILEYLRQQLINHEFDICDYQLLIHFNQHILDHQQIHFEPFHNKMDANDSMEIAYSFLKKIKYSSFFIKKIKSDTIHLIPPDDINTKSELKKIGIVDTARVVIHQQEKIFIFLKETLLDIFQIVHELMHSYNLKPHCSGICHNLTESISVLSEFLLYEELCHSSLKEEAKKCIQYRFYIVQKMAELMHLDFLFLKEYSHDNLDEIIKINQIQQKSLNLYLQNFHYFQTFNFISFQNYVYAIMYATYMNNKKNKVELLRYFNRHLFKIDFADFNHKIGLQLEKNRLDLDLKSYEQVYKAYDQKVKELIR